jgi:hypothetical protein
MDGLDLHCSINCFNSSTVVASILQIFFAFGRERARVEGF